MIRSVTIPGDTAHGVTTVSATEAITMASTVVTDIRPGHTAVRLS